MFWLEREVELEEPERSVVNVPSTELSWEKEPMETNKEGSMKQGSPRFLEPREHRSQEDGLSLQ